MKRENKFRRVISPNIHGLPLEPFFDWQSGQTDVRMRFSITSASTARSIHAAILSE